VFAVAYIRIIIDSHFCVTLRALQNVFDNNNSKPEKPLLHDKDIANARLTAE
jgi:hypothetical protein